MDCAGSNICDFIISKSHMVSLKFYFRMFIDTMKTAYRKYIEDLTLHIKYRIHSLQSFIIEIKHSLME